MHLRNVVMFCLVCAFLPSGCTGDNPQRGYFALQPLGRVDGRLLALMRRFVEIAYDGSCKVMEPLELPFSAYDARRRQYRASELLSFLQDCAPTGALKIVGVTEKDIYTRQMNFIFGLADVRGRCCVVSTCRLRESFWGEPEKEDVLRRRTLKILYHELGHTFGMQHCGKIQCAMCYHNSVPELDASYVWFCKSCTRELEKRVGRFPEDREKKLAKLLTEIGLDRDAKVYAEQKDASQ